jgi:hypothetical protein
MPDDPKDQSAGAGVEEKDAGAGEGQLEGADDKEKSNATDTGKEDAGKGEEEKGGEGADRKDSKGQEGQEKNAKAPQKETPKGDEDDKKDPEVRKRLSPQDYIIQRKKKQSEKQGKKEGGEGDESDEDNEVAPEDKEAIVKVVAKEFAPIFNKTVEAEDNKEIQDFLTENPDFKRYESKVRRFMQHPSRRQLPIKSIFYEVAGDELLRIGAERSKAADQKAKDSQTGGGSNRSGEEGGKTNLELTPEEFEAKKEKIRHTQAE